MGNPRLRCVHVSSCLFIFVLYVWSSLTACSFSFAVKKRPKLKSKYRGRVQKATEYAKTIESWDDLLDPRTLSFYCLRPDPSPYVLRSITIEEKKSKCFLRQYCPLPAYSGLFFFFLEMTTKFNKDMYAKMRAKKDEPLSNLGKKIIRVTGKGSFVVPPADATPIVSGVEGARVASPATSVEEIPTPSSKRPRLSAKDKEKERVGSSIFDDEGAAVERAHNIVRAEDLRVFSGVPVNVVAGQHVHKIVQVRSSTWFLLISIFSFFY